MRLGACVLPLACAACGLYFDEDRAVIDGGGGRPPPDAVPEDAPRDAGIDVRPPAAPTRAHVKVGGGWIDDGAPDWACVGVARDVANFGSLALAGHVRDWFDDTPAGGVSITAFVRDQPQDPLGTVTTAAAGDVGAFDAVFAAGVSGITRYAFEIDNAGAPLTSYLVDQYFAPGLVHARELAVITPASAFRLPTFVGGALEPETAMVGGVVVDCRGRRVSNVVVAFSDNPFSFTPAPSHTFYFSAGEPSVPVTTDGAFTTSFDGRFINFDPPQGPATFLQAWGFASPEDFAAGSMTLLAVIQLQPQPRSSTVLVLEPRQG